jgi:hypothetical protein
MRHIGLSVLFCILFAPTVNGDTIAVWNFNDAISGTTGGEQEFLVDRGYGVMDSDFSAANIGNVSGNTLNSDSGDPAGRALRVSSYVNNERSLTWSTSTEGFNSIGVSLAIQRTSTGFSNNQFLYSIDSGSSWTSFGGFFHPGTSFSLQSFDLSGISALNHNSGAAFRIVFDGASSASGNNKIDNLIVSGNPAAPPLSTPVPESSTVALTSAGLAGIFLFRRYKCRSEQHGGRKSKP